MGFTNKQKRLMKSNALASVKKRKLQSGAVKPQSNRSARLLRQLQYDEHWNTAGYDDTRWYQSEDSNSDKEIEESGDEEEEKD